jgi:rod shape-determining protein MreD
MTEFADRFVRTTKGTTARFRVVVLVLAPLVAILFQVHVAQYSEALAYLDLPLLVTVYFALMRRSPVVGLFLGSAIGLVQDSLSSQPLGMFGIVKTLVGYFAASVSLRVDVENSAVRVVLGFFFYFFHQMLYWILLRALLGQPGNFDPRRELILALLNAAVTLPLFRVLDKLRDRG